MKILIVDDMQDNILLLETLLKGNGYDYASAANGAEALEKLQADDFNMVITDILMPVMDGFQLCREVKSNAKLKHIPVVFYSAAYTDAEDEKLATKLGVDRYIRKPIDPDNFIEIIKDISGDIDEGKVEPKKPAPEKGEDIFKLYNERLVKQLEEKMIDLEKEVKERKRAEEMVKNYSENLEQMIEERTKELNKALQDAETARDRIDGILKSVADGLIVTDNYNRIVLMNRAAEDLLGIRFSEVIDRTIDVATANETLRKQFESVLAKKSSDFKVDFELPAGNQAHPRIMRARTSAIFDRSGEETGLVTIFQDVTHEREVDRMKTEFISTVAHELRTPLTSIQGFSEILLIRDDIEIQEQQKFLSYINKQAKSLADIISDLLDISRIESGIGFSLNRTSCRAGEYLREQVKLFQVRFQDRPFELALPTEDLELFVDREKITQVFENLISNAVKYSPDGGSIRISGENQGDCYRVSITDQGIGMTPEQAARVFDKFYRADASNTAIEGTGLGMNVVKYIVEAHGGEVWLESEFDKGTTVRFTIPLVF